MSVGLDWRIEDSGEQPSRSELPAAGPPRRPWHESRLWRWGRWLLLLLGVALAAGAVWLYTTYRTVQDRNDEDLRRALRLEARAYGEGDGEVFAARQDPDNAAWREQQRQWFEQRSQWPATLPFTYTFTILATGIEGDQAWAEIEESYPGSSQSPFDGGSTPSAAPGKATTYRRVVFYRRAGSDWLHAAPRVDSSYWGPPVTLEGDYFTFTYPARDTAVVEEWLARLEPFARTLCRDLECPPDLRWTIAVTPTSTPRWELGSTFEITDALALTLNSPAVTGYQVDDTLNGVQGYQLVLDILVGAIRHSGGESLLYGGDNRPYGLAASAVAYWELQQTAGTLDQPWMRSLRDMVGQLTAPMHDLFSQEALVPGETYIPLAQLAARQGTPPSLGFDAPQAYSLVEYVVERYGRDRLGDLLRAARGADSFGDALRRALDLPDLAAFERDWLAFGKARYGTP